MGLPEISEQHMLFVQEYCKDKNAVRAALAAGLGATYAAANGQAWSLRKNPSIRAWIRCILTRQAKALKFKPSKVLRNWMLAASADMTYFEVSADGKLGTAPGVPKEYLRAVRKMKHVRTERLGKDNELAVEVRTEIELRDPFGPECKLMEHFGELLPEGADARDPDILARLAALRAARQPAGGGSGPPSGVPPVAAEARPAGDGVAE